MYSKGGEKIPGGDEESHGSAGSNGRGPAGPQGPDTTVLFPSFILNISIECFPQRP